ncbi:cation diffusion facilitator family transporter [Thermogladius sp.]|uniref:cation diffusion facilitator family transporter n=1 Tax=Thermogladius sp. TaxID=2023064 RepID=UPI003D12EBAD
MERDRVGRTILLLALLSVAGGLLKIYGSLTGGSRAVFVDAMTSIGNSVTIALTYKYFRESLKPPDLDHHYGHYKMLMGAPVSTLMVYSFVAGVVLFDLIESYGNPYKVGYESPLFAALAVVPYGVAVAISKSSRSFLAVYGGFTVIELIESSVSIASSIGGMAVSYTIDYAGALVLLGYLLFELVSSFREVILSYSDVAPSDVVERVHAIVKELNVEVSRVRVRKVADGLYQGDVVVRVRPGTPVEEAHAIMDRVEKELAKHGIEVVVHVEP